MERAGAERDSIGRFGDEWSEPDAGEPAAEHDAAADSDAAPSDAETAREPENDTVSEPPQAEQEPSSEHTDPDDTSELGTLSDLSPDWVEEDPHTRNDDEGGEQR